MIKILALSDNLRFIKGDLYNTEETNEAPCRSKRLAFSLQSYQRYGYESNMFSSLPVHSISLNYDLDLSACNMILRTIDVLPYNFEIPQCNTKL